LTAKSVLEALIELAEIERLKGLDLRDGDGARLINGHDLSTSDHVLVDGQWHTAPSAML
jgi:hypothetical protein